MKSKNKQTDKQKNPKFIDIENVLVIARGRGWGMRELSDWV